MVGTHVGRVFVGQQVKAMATGASPAHYRHVPDVIIRSREIRYLGKDAGLAQVTVSRAG
jgi:hypothetical protein